MRSLISVPVYGLPPADRRLDRGIRILEQYSRSLSLGLLFVSALGLLTVLIKPLEPALAKRVGALLEMRISPADLSASARIDGIIALGGSPTRVAEALRLAERFPEASIVLSGPGASEIALAKTHLGDSERLLIDRRATTTYENALYSRDLMALARSSHRNGRWVVVTTAVHMPRSVGAFQAVGMPVLPWPVKDTPQSASALSARVWHEVLGLIGYWVLGRSSGLYPSRSDANV